MFERCKRLIHNLALFNIAAQIWPALDRKKCLESSVSSLINYELKDTLFITQIIYIILAGYYNLAASLWEVCNVRFRMWQMGFDERTVTTFRNLHITEIYSNDDTVYAELSVEMRTKLRNSRSRYVNIL